MNLPLDQILKGDCVEILNSLPERSIDLIFADPPYNLQLQNELHRPNMTKVDAVDDHWDRFDSFEAYDEFTRKWLAACKRVLKPTGAIWVIGSYHNIFRVGTIMQDLGFWILNDVIWVKTNPMPNFRGVRFTNAHETLIWASTGRGARYTFNHHAMKGLNEEKQMRSDWWLLSLATGAERIKDENGDKAHSTQKPEALLYRVILASSSAGDVVLDPFFGSGTTGAVAKRLHRNWIGIEREDKYIKAAQKRIDAIQPEMFDPQTFDVKSKSKSAPKVEFSALVENGYLQPGQKLFFSRDKSRYATIKPDARLRTADGFEGSIHKAGSHYMNGAPCNGWEHWYLRQENGGLISLGEVREKIRVAFYSQALYSKTRQRRFNMTELTITASQIQGNVNVTVLHLKGHLHGLTERDLLDQARQAHKDGARHLLLDMSELEVIASAGLRALQIIFKQFTPQDDLEAMKQRSGEPYKSPYLKLVCPNPQIYYILSITGFLQNIPLFNNLEEAVNSFSA